MTRHILRENVFKLLFISCFEENGPEERAETYIEETENTDDADKAAMKARLDAVLALMPELDERIAETAHGWRIDRMSKVDLSILRLAVYEILYDPDIPDGVAINEAVELAKKYSGDESPAFINGILGVVAKRS